MEKVRIGNIFNTHGLRGEVKVKPLTDFIDERFNKGNTIYIKYNNEYKEMVIKTVKDYKNNLLVVFKDYEDINKIELYKGCDLFVNYDDLHELDEDETYFVDLIDCEVFDENDKLLGKVEEVMETGANAVLRVNKTILIPYVKSFIKEEDLANKKIVIYNIEGLL